MRIKHALGGAVIGAAVLCSNAQANTVTIDFTHPGTSSTEIGSGYGNTLDFGNMTATAWATTGDPHASNYLLNTA